MFWTCDENSVDNTGMFALLLSSAYTESRPFLLLTPPHQQEGWGCTRTWEGTQLGQLTPTDQRDIPHHMASCSAYKAGGRRRKGGTFGVMAFVFPIHRYTWWSPAFLEMAEHLPANGSSEWIPCFVLLACTAFALPIKLSLTQPTCFLTFTLPILSLIPPGAGERAAGWCWAACWGYSTRVHWDSSSEKTCCLSRSGMNNTISLQ